MATLLLSQILQKKLTLNTPIAGQAIVYDGARLANTSGSVSTYRTVKDDLGIFTTIEEKRGDGTLIKRSVLSGGTSPEYTTRTETWFAADGVTDVFTKIYTITYSEGTVVSEVLQPVVRNVTVTANTWGDMRVAWSGNDNADPFTVTLYNGSTVLKTYTTSDKVQFIPVEDSIPAYGFVPSFVKVTVSTGTASATFENNAAVTNSWVEKVIIFGGQSNVGGYFSTLSGTSGRRDLVAAGDVRRAIATAKNIDKCMVIPVDLTYGDSAIEKLATVTADNYWYDLDGAVNGPRLSQFLTGIAQYLPKVASVVWAQGETDTAGSYAGGSRSSTPQRYMDATNAVLDKIRAVLPSLNAKFVWQIMGRSYFNGMELNGVVWQDYRNAQRTVVTNRADTILGSWSPGAERLSGYVDGIHYTSAVYHAAAAQVASSIINNTDRISTPPFWVDMMPVSGGNATKSGNGDTIMTWAASGYARWSFSNRSVSTGNALFTGNLTAATYNFTAAAQTTAYGFTSNIASFVVSGYDLTNDVASPSTTYYITIP